MSLYFSLHLQFKALGKRSRDRQSGNLVLRQRTILSLCLFLRGSFKQQKVINYASQARDRWLVVSRSCSLSIVSATMWARSSPRYVTLGLILSSVILSTEENRSCPRHCVPFCPATPRDIARPNFTSTRDLSLFPFLSFLSFGRCSRRLFARCNETLTMFEFPWNRPVRRFHPLGLAISYHLTIFTIL